MSKTMPEYLLKLCREAEKLVSCESPKYHHLNSGICCLLSYADDHHMAERDAEWREVLRYKDALLARWPEGGGRTGYPVTVPWDELYPEEQEALEDTGYLDDDGTERAVARGLYEAVDMGDLYGGNFWDKGTKYGAARWRLLDWMIEELEKEVSNA